MTVAAVIAMCCQISSAAPRVKRDDIGADEFVLNPVASEVSAKPLDHL